ncbi:endonuclease/ac79 [Cryptophlebia peltastica nucleopolyhedrovirus]|uniref:Endonuclease/ac79 n=1 Tax=Cryptophlebia peltastica nucleopolyhedrovirus TaxID=2304025 RepID=A0A346RNV6_9ABAC|nr:endonuclease/ac79 [Cryptophlebia peltastica nucleopolyhedrovirus]AXS67753.1 endonuclease/ac79 [Cryptophlebia peltastica nucleopolyhedrovirus]
MTTKLWALYLIRNVQNRIYTGISVNVQKRFKKHRTNMGAKCLRGRGPLALIFVSDCYMCTSCALKTERKVKSLTVIKKLNLNMDVLKKISGSFDCDTSYCKNKNY